MAQGRALAYYAALAPGGDPEPVFRGELVQPRRNVLWALKAKGLVTVQTVPSRTRNQNRWRYDYRVALTDEGRAAAQERSA